MHQALVTLTLLVFIPSLSAQAAVRSVPTPFETIQAAIDASSNGDTVEVGSGTYREHINTSGKELVLIGSGPGTSVIDGSDTGRCVYFDGGGEMRGFTITNGGNVDYGGGVAIFNKPANINNCIVTECSVGFFDFGVGGGIYVDDSVQGATISNCTIDGNIAGDSGGGIHDKGQFTVIEDNVIRNNSCHVAGGGLYTGGGYIRRNILADNHSDSFAGGIYGGGMEISNNTLVRNNTGNSIPQGAGMHIEGAVIIRNNIVTGSFGRTPSAGVGILCRVEGANIECNDSWGNNGPDYDIDCPGDHHDNTSIDPRFCDAEAFDFHLAQDSPCINYPGCGLIGALEMECSTSPVRRISTWSSIKTLHTDH